MTLFDLQPESFDPKQVKAFAKTWETLEFSMERKNMDEAGKKDKPSNTRQPVPKMVRAQ